MKAKLQSRKFSFKKRLKEKIIAMRVSSLINVQTGAVEKETLIANHSKTYMSQS